MEPDSLRFNSTDGNRSPALSFWDINILREMDDSNQVASTYQKNEVETNHELLEYLTFIEWACPGNPSKIQ
jgi:hypothetical protein